MYYPERQLSVVVHGDEFTALGARADILWYKQGIEQVFELKLNGVAR